MCDVTQLLHALDAGDPKAADQLLPLVYEELRKLAAVRMAQEKPGQTSQATALVHEAWLRLVGNQAPELHGRGHFFAAKAMRRILIDQASECTTGDPRRAFLDQACGSNAALRAEVEDLPHSEEVSGGFLADPKRETAPVHVPLAEQEGDCIGRHRLLQKIGEDGWGVVYMAEQTEPVRRHMALKVIKRGMDRRSMLARFEMFIGTPACMSPEQTGFNALDIDTRTDIHALGVLRPLRLAEPNLAEAFQHPKKFHFVRVFEPGKAPG